MKPSLHKVLTLSAAIVAVSLAARVKVAIPGSPVPHSLQTLAGCGGGWWLGVGAGSAVGWAVEGGGVAGRRMLAMGEGSVAAGEGVVERPIETILSGPAASVIGARVLSGVSD